MAIYIGLGANLDHPAAQLRLAIDAMNALPTTHVVACSSFYRSAPVGPQDQPDFVNAVAEIHTELTPLALLDALQGIERDQGRVKRRHWGERCIDLDILLYHDHTQRSDRLNLPHHEMTRRGFVVQPLLEIAPGLTLPDGQRLDQITPEFGNDLQRLDAAVIDL